MRDDVQYALGGWAGGRLLDTLLATVRFELPAETEFAPDRVNEHPVVFVLWHGRLLPLTYLYRHRGVATLISRSGDGEYIARVVEHWGYHIARGSSSRGGSRALRELVQLARQGRSLAITPDGPRGPREVLKPGALLAAQLTGHPLLPIAAGADRAWWFGKWDRFMVPKPFARVRIAWGQPIDVPRRADDATLERIRLRAEAELKRVTRLVDESHGG